MMLQASRAYGRRGWRIMPLHGIRGGHCTCGRQPCTSVGKHPRLADWPAQATTDEAIIAEWFETRPDANVAIVTGNGLVVLDVDPRHGGDETLVDIEHAHGSLPETPRVLTGGGGVHVYFAVAQPVGNRAGLAPGIDLRGDGGFVVAPPSIHANARRYAWELGLSPDDISVAPVPPWLVERLTGGAPDRLRADGAPLVIHQGERNHRLYQLAGLLRRYGLSERAISGSLAVINQEHAVPPLKRDEVVRIAVSATRHSPSPEAFLPSAAFPPSPGDDDFEAVVAGALRTDT
jgi:putative DNA primase/helicase